MYLHYVFPWQPCKYIMKSSATLQTHNVMKVILGHHEEYTSLKDYNPSLLGFHLVQLIHLL